MSPVSESEQTHPELAKSVIARYNSYIRWAQDHQLVAKWIAEVYGGAEIFDSLSDALIADPEVRALGDQRCLALYPVLWDSQAPKGFVPTGGKAKAGRGVVVPSMLARLADDSLILAMWLDRGYMIDIFAKDEIRSVTAIWFSIGFFQKVPGIQITAFQGGETDWTHVTYGDLFPSEVNSEIVSALTRGYSDRP